MLDPRNFINLSLHTEFGPLLMLAIILMAGLAGGRLAKLVRLPSVTGNILAGILIGPTVLNLFHDMDLAQTLKPLTTFAMGLITVAVGSQLSYRRIHNALRRILTIALFEAVTAMALVALLMYLLGLAWPLALVLGALAVETAPASTVAVVRETRAKGTFVKTLLSVVALDNMLCIILFAFSSVLLMDHYAGTKGADIGVSWALMHTAWQFTASLLLGLGLGAIVERLVHTGRLHDFSTVFMAILIAVGLSTYLELSALLTCLFLGLYLGNSSEEATRQTGALAPIEPLLFASFFTIAGAGLHFDMLVGAGLFCAAYIVMRYIGKGLGASLGGIVARAPRRIWQNMSISLLPQAGVSVGLVVLLSANPRVPEQVSELVVTLILGAVTVNEILGPLSTRAGLRRTQEVNKDRRRLIEFLQEEYIATDIRAEDKWEALRKMVDFFILTHHVPHEERAQLYESVVEREKEQTTAVGHMTAIPHGRVDWGRGIKGVLGICHEGVDFGAHDGKPVKIIMLVVTPKGYEREHLEIMASLVQIICQAPVRERLVSAISPYDAWEIIESRDTRNINYFLEEEDREPPGEAAH